MIDDAVEKVKKLILAYTALIRVADKIIIDGDVSENWKNNYLVLRGELDILKDRIRNKE